MKRGVQIQRQGKVKDVRASAAASGLPTEEIDSTVALIQALIPLGLQAVGEALDAEVTTLAGTRYCGPRDCAPPFRRCSASRPWSNAVSGTSVSTSCGICRKLSRRPGAGDYNRP